MLENSFLWIYQFCQFCQFPEIHEKLSSSLFYEYLGIAPSIPHFKDLSMRNLQYEMGICQKIHNKVTMQWQVFAKFVNFLKSKKSYLPAFL
jgi:hypothetical protein